jgi:hypothetical protein
MSNDFLIFASQVGRFHDFFGLPATLLHSMAFPREKDLQKSSKILPAVVSYPVDPPHGTRFHPSRAT